MKAVAIIAIAAVVLMVVALQANGSGPGPSGAAIIGAIAIYFGVRSQLRRRKK